MNKIFKVIWNHSTQTWAVVSELTKTHSKTKSSTTAIATAAISVIAALGVGTSQAAVTCSTAIGKTPISTATANGKNTNLVASTDKENQGVRVFTREDGHLVLLGNITLQSRTQASGTKTEIANKNISNFKAVAVGDEIVIGNGDVSGNDSVAMGRNIRAYGTRSVLMGQNVTSSLEAFSVSSGDRTDWSANDVVIGNNLTSTSGNSIVVGRNSSSETQHGIAIGTDNATVRSSGSIAIGKSVDAKQGIVIGGNSIVNGQTAVAMGYGVSATGAETVAIGSDANASAHGAISIGRMTGANQSSAIAIGRQMYARNQYAIAIGQVGNADAYASLAIGASAAVGANAARGIAIGSRAQAIDGNYSLAVGFEARTNGEESTSVGRGSKVFSAYSNAFGGMNKIEAGSLYANILGNKNTIQADGNYSTVVGNNNTLAVDNTMIFGNDITATQANSVVLGNASTDRAATAVNDATVNGIAYSGFAGNGTTAEMAAKNGVVSVGAEGRERQIINVAAGKIAEDSTDAINGSQLYLVAHNLVSHLNTAAPVTYSKADGTKLVRIGDKFYPLDPNTGLPVLTKEEGGKTVANDVPSDQVVTNMGGTSTGGQIGEPTALGNVKGNLTPTYNVGDKQEVNGKPTGSVVADNAYTKAQTAPSGEQIGKIYNNAATVGDVLNAGFNLQDNGNAKDFVKPYDTLNFVNGTGTTVEVLTDEKGNVSNIKVNSLTSLVDAQGNSVVAVVKTDSAGNVVMQDGKPVLAYYHADDVDSNGKPKQGKTQIDTTTNPLHVNVVNPLDQSTKTPTQLGNLAAGANTIGDKTDGGKTLVKVGNQYYSPDSFTNGVLNNNAQPVNTGTAVTSPLDLAKSGLLDLAHSNPNHAITVEDLRKLGWVISSDKFTDDLTKEYAADVRNANEVRFVGKGAAVVSGKTDGDVRTITVNVDTQKLSGSMQFPVVYTDASGNKVVKIGNEFYPENVVVADDGKVYPQGTTLTNGKAPTGTAEAKPINDKSTIVASMNNGENQPAPTTLQNVKGNLTPTYNAGDKQEVNGKPTGSVVADNAYTKAQTAPSGEQIGKIYNNAATVGDVLNAGFNLQDNGNAKDFVKPYDTLNFVNGTGTTVEVLTDEKGNVSNIKVNSLTSLVDAQGNSVVAVVKTDSAGNVVMQDGKPVLEYYHVDDVDSNGKPKQGKTKIDTTTNPLHVNVVNPLDQSTKTPTQLGNLAAGANTFAPKPADNATNTPAEPHIKLANDGKWYNAENVEANGNAKAGAEAVEKPSSMENIGLVDFSKSNPNNAATIGDLQNLGFVLGTSENSYNDQVRNGNKVDIVGDGKYIQVTGSTKNDGTREIKVALKQGEVIKSNEGIISVDDQGNSLVKDGDHWYKTSDIDPTTGKPKDNTVQPVEPNNVTNKIVVNVGGKWYDKANIDPTTGKPKADAPTVESAQVEQAGDGFVTGNKVADAIQEAGWTIGKQSVAEAKKVNFANSDEKVNPNDNVRFADGANSLVSLGTMVETNAKGEKVTTTTVKVDVTGLPIQYTAADGTPVAKVGDTFYKVDVNGKPNLNAPVQAGSLVTNIVNPATTPNQIGEASSVGNVKGNLAATYNAGDKQEVNGKPTGGAVADNAYTKAQPAPSGEQIGKIYNNAATAGDVLNAGWNLQANGLPQDFVKAYDTVNFADGDGTKVDLLTNPKGNLTSIRFSIDKGDLAADPNQKGRVKGPSTKEQAKVLNDQLAAAKKALLNNTDPDQFDQLLEAVNNAKKAVDEAGLNRVATAQNVADAINDSGWLAKVRSSDDYIEENQNGKIFDKNGNEYRDTPLVNPGKSVIYQAGSNLNVKQQAIDEGFIITYAVSNNLNLTDRGSLNVGGVTINEYGINVGNKRITNVANGQNPNDAVNVSQLRELSQQITNVNNRIINLDKVLSAGIAGVLASGNLYHATLPGKSMFSAGMGNFRGQSSVAVGYSRLSDNGKVGIKFSVNMNKQGNVGTAAAFGLQW